MTLRRRTRDWPGMSINLAGMFAAASELNRKRAEGRAEDALTEIRAMGIFARRSLGQQLRHMRNR